MTKLLQQALDALLPHSSSHGNSWRPVEDAAIKAIEQALAQQESSSVLYHDNLAINYAKLAQHCEMLEAKLAQQEQPAQEQVTVLPDGSAFSIMSSPLPADHWLYREREYATPESEETVDLPPPFVNRTTENRELIRLAAMWAIRAATDCGKENDFDPDALVQNFVYATLGPYPQKIKDTAPTQPALIDEMVKQSKMLDSYNDRNIFIDGWLKCEEAHCRGGAAS